MTRPCAECKGRGFCGLMRCPVMARFHARTSMKSVDSYMGGAPSVFIGTYGYPQVSRGPLLIGESDSPKEWIAKEYSIDDIVGMRSRTIRGNAPPARLKDAVQEVALSAVPVDVEAAFLKPVSLELKFDGTVAPVGLSGDLRAIDVLDNPTVPRTVERITGDTDLRATEAVGQLYQDGIDVYHISDLMSAGLLGVKRKVVPTRWGITAVDDTISKALRALTTRFQPLQEIQIFSTTLYANMIVCIFVPGDWRYEMIEVLEKGSLWGGENGSVVQDQETMKKRNYSPIAGAYYAARLAATDYLNKIRRSARVIIVRRVTSDYWAPLGVWVVREACRKALDEKPIPCDTLQEAIFYTSMILGSESWRFESRLIPELLSQKTLFDF